MKQFSGSDLKEYGTVVRASCFLEGNSPHRIWLMQLPIKWEGTICLNKANTHTCKKKKNAGQRSKKFFKYLYKAASQLWGRETIFSLLYCRSSLSSWRGHSSQLLYWQRFVEKPTVAYKVFNSKNPTDFSFWAFALQLRINFGSSLQQESKSCARPAVNLLAHLCHQEHKSCNLQTTVNLPLQN